MYLSDKYNLLRGFRVRLGRKQRAMGNESKMSMLTSQKTVWIEKQNKSKESRKLLFTIKESPKA